ncbi:conserved hypothetical protein [Ricinus communis]|uniref:Uncharacterized protein n=1 Tax=Ricinus communis TaxID=3988 RepID=B9RSC4_RICCO|nr:conserved hypothetical protein [Ricinus communis]
MYLVHGRLAPLPLPPGLTRVRQMIAAEVERARVGFSYDELAEESEARVMLATAHVVIARTPSTIDPRVGTNQNSFHYRLTAPEGVVFGDLLHLISEVVMMPSNSGYISRYAHLDESFAPKYQQYDTAHVLRASMDYASQVCKAL